MTGPSGQFFAFSDGHPARPQISALWWFAVRFGDPSFVDDHEKRLFARMCALRTANAEDENDVPRDFPIGLLWVDAYSRMSKAVASPCGKNGPSVVVLRGEMPLAVLRGAPADTNGIYIATKGGSPSYNHGHADEGTFVLDMLGERWAYDLGAEDYTAIERAIGASALWSPEPDSRRWTLFRLGTQGHNTLMIGGQGQHSKGFATISQPEDGVVEVNLSELYPMAKGVVRRFHLDEEACYIEDSVCGVAPGTIVRWAMVTDAEVSVWNDLLPVAELRKNGKTMKILFESNGVPDERRVSVREARPENAYERQNEGFRQVGFEFKTQDEPAKCSAWFCQGIEVDK